MAINKNHEFEELDGVKCAIVEKNASKERVEFLKQLLQFNKYTVVVVPSPPPKLAAVPKPAVATETSAELAPLPIAIGTESPPQPPASVDISAKVLTSAETTADKPETFTIGVTDVTFNPTNAIFGRMLKTPDGHFVTLAYWEQKETTSDDETPYYEQKN